VPAAAVIPAPKAYIQVAAVKKLVVGFPNGLKMRFQSFAVLFRSHSTWSGGYSKTVSRSIFLLLCPQKTQ